MDILKFLNEAGVLRDVIWIIGVFGVIILIRATSIKIGDKILSFGKTKDEKSTTD